MRYGAEVHALHKSRSGIHLGRSLYDAPHHGVISISLALRSFLHDAGSKSPLPWLEHPSAQHLQLATNKVTAIKSLASRLVNAVPGHAAKPRLNSLLQWQENKSRVEWKRQRRRRKNGIEWNGPSRGAK